MEASKTYTSRSNARRAGVQAGIPDGQVEVTVHKSKGEVRFGFKRAEPTQTVTPAKAAVAAKATPAVTTPAAPRGERNGVKRPAPGGVCAAVWDYLDKNPSITVKEAKAAAADHGWNENNVSCEFYQWRKFHAVTGMQSQPRQPARRIDGEVDQYAV